MSNITYRRGVKEDSLAINSLFIEMIKRLNGLHMNTDGCFTKDYIDSINNSNKHNM